MFPYANLLSDIVNKIVLGKYLQDIGGYLDSIGGGVP